MSSSGAAGGCNLVRWLSRPDEREFSVLVRVECWVMLDGLWVAVVEETVGC